MIGDITCAVVAVGVLLLIWIQVTGSDTQCPLCGGHGERKVDGRMVRCVICGGKGVVR